MTHIKRLYHCEVLTLRKSWAWGLKKNKLTRMSYQGGGLRAGQHWGCTERVTSGQEMVLVALAFCFQVSRKALAASPAVTAPISFCQDAMQWVAPPWQNSAERVTSGDEQIWILWTPSLDAPESIWGEKTATVFTTLVPILLKLLHCKHFMIVIGVMWTCGVLELQKVTMG